MALLGISALVVDDCSFMRSIVSSILKGVGVTIVREAGDGAAALQELSLSPCDIIICDMAMDPLDGLEFTRLLRTAKDSPGKRIPVIMMTAHTERSNIMAARDAGVNEVVLKPLSAKTLIDRLAAAIDHPRPFVVSAAYSGPCRRRKEAAHYAGPRRRAEDAYARADQWEVLP